LGRTTQPSRRYLWGFLFVAIDRTTRRVFVRVYNSKTAANARRFLRDLERACSLRIRSILTPFRDIAAQYPVGQWTELLSNLVFEVCRSCGDLVGFGGFNSVFERDACDDFGQIIKAT
jgi:hypothetical protein